MEGGGGENEATDSPQPHATARDKTRSHVECDLSSLARLPVDEDLSSLPRDDLVDDDLSSPFVYSRGSGGELYDMRTKGLNFKCC